MKAGTVEMVKFLVILIIAGFLGVALYAVTNGADTPRSRQMTYVRACIIEHKELPRPDLYCNAMWEQSEGQGGR